MNSNDLVSICIPTFQRPVEIMKAINSCLSQSYQNFEIIISDNSIDDITKEKIEKLNNEKIKYFKNGENIGAINNINQSIRLSNGKFIKLLMDDDILEGDALQLMLEKFNSYKNIGVVMAPLNVINEKDEYTFYRAYLIKKLSILYRYQNMDSLIPKKKLLFDFLTQKYPCCIPSGLMIKRECFQKLGYFDPKIRFAADVEICARFASTYDFYYIDQPLASWRYSKNSDTVANLHSKGIDTYIYYLITDTLLNNQLLRDNFSSQELIRLHREAYFFSSKRAVLAILAGVQSRNWKLIHETIKLIIQKEKYLTNLLKLPFNLMIEIVIAFLSWFKPRRS